MSHTKFVISAFIHETIKRIHATYPNQEWSGIARAEKKDGYYLISDIVFGDQQNSSSLTTISEKGFGEILETIIERNPEHMHEYNVWLHSHHSMSCFWSGTDEAQKQSFDNGDRSHFFHIVTNYDKTTKEPGYLGALTFYNPINIEFSVDVSVEGDMQKAIDNCSGIKESIEAIRAENIEKEIDIRTARHNEKEVVSNELITLTDGIKNQRLDTILTEDMISVINPADKSKLIETITQNVESIKNKKIEELYKMYDKKLKSIDAKYEKQIEGLEQPVLELINACVPFDEKVNELKGYVNKHSKQGKGFWGTTPNALSTVAPREDDEYVGRRDREQTLFQGEYDPLAHISDEYKGNASGYSIINGVLDNVENFIEEVVRDNKYEYKYNTYVYRNYKSFPVPEGFEQFKKRGDIIEIYGWNVPLENIYDEILLQKGWKRG